MLLFTSVIATQPLEQQRSSYKVSLRYLLPACSYVPKRCQKCR